MKQSAEMQYQNGIRLYYGIGEIQNIKRAVEQFQAAAAQGHVKAQYLFKICYDNATGRPRNTQAVVELLQQGVKENNPTAQSHLGACYDYGHGIPRDLKRATELYQRAVNQGDAAAQFALAVCYDSGEGVPADNKRAIDLYQQAVNQGYAMAQFNLGIYYTYGQQGVPKNKKRATELFRQAADQGIPEAQFNLGVCYSFGRGVPQDYTCAIEWYQLAANQGHGGALYNLASHYSSGRGVPRDPKRCEELIRQLIKQDQDEITAVYVLGRCYDSGQDVMRDRKRAVELYKLAAKHRHKEAQSILANRKIHRGYRDHCKSLVEPNGSDGDSDNEDEDIVWRGVTAEDKLSIENGLGLSASTTKTGKELNEEIREHVQRGSEEQHKQHCSLLSASRSKKVAARYACDTVNRKNNATNLMVKIQLDQKTGRADLTDRKILDEVGLTGVYKKWAENSQEVVIFSKIPQESLSLYKVKKFFSEKAYQEAKKRAGDNGTHFVRFRSYEKDRHWGFSITRCMDEVAASLRQLNISSASSNTAATSTATSSEARMTPTTAVPTTTPTSSGPR